MVTFSNLGYTSDRSAPAAQGGTTVIPANTRDTEACKPITEVLQRIGDKWTVLIVGLLAEQPRRFNELRRMTGGISQRMLTLTLRGLERDGLVSRAVFPTVPPRVDYALTDLGRTLIEPVNAIAHWARRNRPAMVDARTRYDAANPTAAATAQRTSARPASPRRAPASAAGGARPRATPAQ